MALLEVRGLRKRMAQGPDIRAVNLEVDASEIVGLLGSDYAAMILRLLDGTARPDAGDIWFAGQRATGWSQRQRIAAGLVHATDQPRGPWWYPRSWRRRMTVGQMVAWAVSQTSRPAEPARRSDEILEQLGLGRLRSNRFGRLSGGERRRALLAQALALDPKLLLLDEPLLNVDPLTGSDLAEVLHGLSREGLGVLVARAPIDWQTRVCQRMYLIKDGHVVCHGKPGDLVRDPDAIRLYFGDRYADPGGAVEPAIFLCYRRDDSFDATHRLYEQLADRFGKEAVMMDVDSIPAGEDFRQFLHQAVSRCAVLLAVIGDHWLKAANEAGESRLHDEQDYVRYEIATALQLRKDVIPVLVGRAAMPGPAELPAAIEDLAYRQAAEVRSGRGYQDHADSLMHRLEELFRAGR